jgi:hypothetical protein
MGVKDTALIRFFLTEAKCYIVHHLHSFRFIRKNANDQFDEQKKIRRRSMSFDEIN